MSVAAFSSSRRRISQVGRSEFGETKPNTLSNLEMDSHADTSCFGSNFTPISFTGQTCDVTPYTDSYEAMKDVPIASAATAWDNPETGTTIILEFHQGLWFGPKLQNSLINPNQC